MDDDVHSARAECDGERTADAVSGPGHECHPTGELRQR
jgi:hypothetical protein